LCASTNKEQTPEENAESGVQGAEWEMRSAGFFIHHSPLSTHH
jgi:hypothetical protein